MTPAAAYALMTDQLAEYLAAVVERQDHPTAQMIAGYIREGRQFTFRSLGMLLDVEPDVLIHEFECEATRHGQIIAARYRQ